jgi:hypothetical protein
MKTAPLIFHIWYDKPMKNKTIRVRKSRLEDQGKERDLEGTTPAERVAMVRTLTRNAWAFRGIDIDKQRLQRHIVRLRPLGS